MQKNIEGYYFRYGVNCDYFGVTVQLIDTNVDVKVYRLDELYLATEEKENLVTGDKYMTDAELHTLVLEIDVWSKYYFPTYTNEDNQWYHKTDEDDTCYITMMAEVTKFAYNKAIKLISIY